MTKTYAEYVEAENERVWADWLITCEARAWIKRKLKEPSYIVGHDIQNYVCILCGQTALEIHANKLKCNACNVARPT